MIWLRNSKTRPARSVYSRVAIIPNTKQNAEKKRALFQTSTANSNIIIIAILLLKGYTYRSESGVTSAQCSCYVAQWEWHDKATCTPFKRMPSVLAHKRKNKKITGVHGVHDKLSTAIYLKSPPLDSNFHIAFQSVWKYMCSLKGTRAHKYSRVHLRKTPLAPHGLRDSMYEQLYLYVQACDRLSKLGSRSRRKHFSVCGSLN